MSDTMPLPFPDEPMAQATEPSLEAASTALTAPVDSNSKLSTHAPLPSDEANADISRIEELISEIGKLQLSIARQLADKNTEIMEVEQRHSVSLNPKLIKTQELFDELQGLSHRYRKLLIGRGKGKTFKRNVGSGSWRDQVRVDLVDDDKVIMATLRKLGPAFSRAFISRRIVHEVNLSAMGSLKLRERAATVPGVNVRLDEDFSVKPGGGYPMTSAKPYWPALKDMPGPLQQDYISGE
jgi:phage host-nuclease inhibitor protein Gam